MERTLFLALLLTACTGPANSDGSGNPGHNSDINTDTGSDADSLVHDVMIASTINYATWNDDMTAVVDNVTDVEGVNYTPDIGDPGTTIAFVDMQAGEHTFSYTFTDGSASYVGQATKTIATSDTDPTIKSALCVDLTGDWDCQNEYEGKLYAPYKTHIDTQSNCQVTADDVDFNTDKLDGQHLITYDDLDRLTFDGIVSDDAKVLTLNQYGNSGKWFGVDTCTKQ